MGVQPWRPGRRRRASSRWNILETLLHQAEIAHRPLDDDVADLAQGMIANSDDSDATQLWDLIGGSGAIETYDDAAGLTQTSSTRTRATGERRPHRRSIRSDCSGSWSWLDGLLNQASRDYQLGLMENVEADQAWGAASRKFSVDR